MCTKLGHNFCACFRPSKNDLLPPLCRGGEGSAAQPGTAPLIPKISAKNKKIYLDSKDNSCYN